MKRALIVLVLIAVLGVGLASCASLFSRPDGSNAARTSCVGLINIGSCNVTQTHNTNTGSSSLGILAALGVGCLLLGSLWPSSSGKTD
jgi:hypothetical protein